jgi:hypothetical protein
LGVSKEMCKTDAVVVSLAGVLGTTGSLIIALIIPNILYVLYNKYYIISNIEYIIYY